MIMWLDLESVLIGLAAGLLVYYIKYRHWYRLPPGPFALPVIGNYKGEEINAIYRSVKLILNEK
jgi:hypothetical protein